MTKTPVKSPRNAIYDEAWLRSVLEDALKKSPLYGHRLCTRARHILMDSILDEVAAEIAAEKLAEG